ncbi:MAG TPA: asparagine synthase (glutamine-hydrolyzing) [Candidatus Eisenbacteria bacterium]|nr:asparagine synthase (glutamine-hydrolyzing) [Candidatus Eisenbacteria bacterium]
MCGIAGIWGDGESRLLETAVGRMVAAQQHRGPDEACTVAVPTGPRSLVLGFDRLAIIDLTPDASQPMRDPATGSWLVFNGEIYNFRELRAELSDAGYPFRSRGDSEVLLAVLVRFGAAATLPRLRGMYAFAFYDGRTRRLVLGRDPFGIKPLLYARVGGAFVFASELRAVRAAGLGPLSLDREALGAYLAFGAVPEPHTIAREVRMLPPGHVLEVDAHGAQSDPRPVHVIESLLGEPERGDVGWEDAVVDVERVLTRTVESHLVSDVPVGVLLSGGIDSTLVASVAARYVEPHFLTVGFDDPRFSEVATARATALRLGGRHHVVSLSPGDVLGVLPAALAAMDQPTADGVNTFVIARAAAERGIKVLVSGLGGDEVFGGYTTFRKAPFLAAHARWLAPLARGLAVAGAGNVAQWRKIAAASAVRDLVPAYLLQRALGCEPAPEAVLPAGVRVGLAPPPSASDYRRVSYLELVFYLRNQLLHDADVFSSASSVELRVPFLDVDVLRQAWTLPAAWHLGRVGRRKRMLRAVLRRLEPAHPVGRAKMGFAFPWDAWLRGPLAPHVATTLADRDAHDALGIDVAESVRLLAAFRRRDARFGWAQVWSRFVLVEWYRRAGLAAPAGAVAAPSRATA